MGKSKYRGLIPGIILITLNACNVKKSNDEIQTFHPSYKLSVTDAQGFEIDYQENYTKVLTKSFGENSFFRDSIILPYDTSYNVKSKLLSSHKPQLNIQSSTHLAFLKQLKALHLVKGVCGLNFVVNQGINDSLAKNNAVEICNSDRLSIENILASTPDLMLIYPFGSVQNNEFEKIQVPFLYIAEYLENNVIARLEWIKLFGVLLGKEKLADTYFNEIKAEYQETRNLALKNDSSTFIMNLPFNDNWYMPAKNSLIVNLISDAGLNYFYNDVASVSENSLRPKEQVWIDGNEADYWVIIAARPEGFGLEDLIREDPVYGTFKSVQQNHVIFCNSNLNDYFVLGILEPHIMLKDILLATGHSIDHTPVYFKLLK